MISDIEAVADPETARRSFERLELVENYERSGRVEQLAIEMHREIGFDRIISISEFDLLRAAKLRDLLGIEGQRYESALAFRNKLRMKDIASAAGLAVPAYRRVDTPADVFAFVEEHGPRIVLKPIVGAGATHTYMIRSFEDVHRVMAEGIFGPAELPSAFEVESLVDGVMHHVDGIYQDGAFIALWPSVYVSPCHVYAQGIMHASTTLALDNPLAQRLCAFVEKLLAALPTPASTGVHAEIFHTTDDRLVLCEIASRVGGPRIPDLFRTATDFELVPAMIQGQAGRKLVAPHGGVRPHCVAGFMNIPAKSGVLERAPAECHVPGAIEYKLVGTIGERYAQSTDLGDFVSTFLFRGDSEAAVRTAIFETSDWFDAACRWAP
ncbi:MAG: ATP-grasp domain-containing protein [Kofleriaceae bacterium]